MPRVESDFLGDVTLPDSAYYGVQTARAIANFTVSGQGPSLDLVRAGALLKKAAVLANTELGLLDRERGRAIEQACDDILAGWLNDQFPVDAFQAGAGTSFNMNLNEVIANRALELLGRARGEYAFIGPNDHVNRCQSSNDAFPTMVHIAVSFAADKLLVELGRLAAALRAKADEFAAVAKPGRTHLVDALPVTVGQELGAYATAVERAGERLAQRRDDLLEVALGGTAVGNGANADPRFQELALARLSELTGLALRPARDAFEALQSRSQLAAFSGALRELAVELGRIANDFRLLGSGPFTALGELRLPAVQPGSSIMPGKVNPSLAECLNMVCFQAIGNDTTVALAAQAGQLELNVMAPVMAHNILVTAGMFNAFLPVFTDKCVAGIEVDAERCRAGLALNPALATLLVPRIGYAAAAKLAERAARERRPVPEIAVEQGLVGADEAARLFGTTGG